jgi:very-short-patch-repair endonuclease
LFLDAIDIDYLHQTGKIKSTKKYNQFMGHEGFVVVNNKNDKVLNSIQGIIENLKIYCPKKLKHSFVICF